MGALKEAVEAVQTALGAHQRTQVMEGERFGGGLLNARIVIRCTCGEPWNLDHVAVAAAGAAAPHIAADALREAADSAATEPYLTVVRGDVARWLRERAEVQS